MYSFKREPSMRTMRKTIRALIFACAALAFLSIVLFFLFRPAISKSNKLDSAMITSVQQDITSAQKAVLQLTRTGGSTTRRLLTEIAQSLYSVKRMNELSTRIGEASLIPPDLLESALSAIVECESLLSAARSIDAPQATLIQLMGELTTGAAALR